jgi:hypothetical protein
MISATFSVSGASATASVVGASAAAFSTFSLSFSAAQVIAVATNIAKKKNFFIKKTYIKKLVNP